jgi:Uncharacterized protein conserved in bacteria (DUF2252)
MKTIVESTAAYEAWIESQIELYQSDLATKHQEMTESVFAFFRATFYRWAELWTLHCPELAKLYRVEAVGDLHIQNFGTWRDREGRLVWGVNDFDEAGSCAFTNDLVRLAVSIKLADEHSSTLKLAFAQVAEEIWKGYRKGVAADAKPFVLEKTNGWLLRLARTALKEPKVFWRNWLEQRTEPSSSHSDFPAEAAEVLHSHFPKGAKVQLRVAKTGARPKGLGSLGHRRVFAYAEWQGGPIAREAKASAGSALLWAAGKPSEKIRIMDFLSSTVRPMSPHVKMVGKWLLRPIQSETGRIEVSELRRLAPEERQAVDQRRLFQAMGFETANTHLLFAPQRDLQKAAEKLKPAQLEDAAEKMAEATLADFKQWRKHWKPLRG